MRLPPGDHRLGVGVEALLGKNCFSSPDLQAQWDPIVLQQCQQVGMLALTKTMELASPRPRYTTVKQEPREPYLKFVEHIAVSLEKQVDDEVLRQALLKQLAKDNVNKNCQKIIDALPGNPSVAHMVSACSKVGTMDHQMTALAAILRPTPQCYNCNREGHLKANCPDKSNGEKPKVLPNPPTLGLWCPLIQVLWGWGELHSVTLQLISS
ncbi:endogenous retrovirus group K member 21 Gag polyprotein-like [Neopelma chrysocephalum]|uniref:endogenous retrovirus group K member 21 Gag polyprotein-like n=1 Tax=Neopelma chrysocephalum TaxID=114329 RepID=UPI000FCCE1AC|nr:endogenous retrovirus group K member 21 Gag polyprotein-like [Neopelma chrysocephalum]